MIQAALDTSSGSSFAIQTPSGVHSATLLAKGRDSDRTLVPWILERLREYGLDPKDVERWTVGTGPGSFSGLRVGIAFIKGICQATGALYRGMPSSLALAAAALQATEKTEGIHSIAVLHDARREQIILSSFRAEDEHFYSNCEPEVLSREDLAAQCQKHELLITPHAKAVHKQLPMKFHSQLLTVETVDAAFLLRVGHNLPWPESQKQAEDTTNPIYVRPAVFVEPQKQQRRLE